MEYSKISTKDGTGYFNEKERNVHVWCTKLDYDKNGYINRYQLLLYGGFYNHGAVTFVMFYEWMQMIGAENIDIVLVSGSDPRQISDLNENSEISYDFLTRMFPGKVETHKKNDKKTVPAGHYFIYQKTPAGLTPSRPALRTIREAEDEKKSKTLKVQDAKRDLTFRNDVRLRDRKCVLTKKAVEFRDRGPDFCGFQAAHIYPFAALGKAIYRALIEREDEGLFDDMLLADGAANGMLLTAELHLQYDSYNWGVWVKSEGITRIYETYCFANSSKWIVESSPELTFPNPDSDQSKAVKSGRPTRAATQPKPPGPNEPKVVTFVSMHKPKERNFRYNLPIETFFREQFKLCLIKHVAGGGAK